MHPDMEVPSLIFNPKDRIPIFLRIHNLVKPKYVGKISLHLDPSFFEQPQKVYGRNGWPHICLIPGRRAERTAFSEHPPFSSEAAHLSKGVAHFPKQRVHKSTLVWAADQWPTSPHWHRSSRFFFSPGECPVSAHEWPERPRF